MLALLYVAFGTSRFEKARDNLEAAIERGEQLCEVYERWRRLVPSSDFQFEHLMLLGEAITREGAITFGHCANCRAIIVIDQRGTLRSLCDRCARARREDVKPSSHSEDLQEDEETDLVLYRLQLLGGQFLYDRKGS